MIETQIKDSLLKLQAAIADGDAGRIKDNMALIDGALTEHRKEIDPQLKHYLKNRSYMKALSFLTGEADIPKGRCGGRTDFS